MIIDNQRKENTIPPLTFYTDMQLSLYLIQSNFPNIWCCVVSCRVVSCLITSLQYSFDLRLPLHVFSTTNLSHLLTSVFANFLFICPNHLIFISLIFSTTKITLTFSWITSLWILSFLICLHIHLNIFTTKTCVFQKTHCSPPFFLLLIN